MRTHASKCTKSICYAIDRCIYLWRFFFFFFFSFTYYREEDARGLGSRCLFVIDRTVIHRTVVHVRVFQVTAFRVTTRRRRFVRLKIIDTRHTLLNGHNIIIMVLQYIVRFLRGKYH